MPTTFNAPTVCHKILSDEQTSADPERTDAAMKVMDLVYAEMEPGDALFFHSNTLHRSDQNKSPNPRWSLLCCYNTKHKIRSSHPIIRSTRGWRRCPTRGSRRWA